MGERGRLRGAPAAGGRRGARDRGRGAGRRALRGAGGRSAAVAKRMAKAARPAGVPPAPETLADAAAFASWLTRAITVGDIDARTGHEAAYSLRAFQAMVEKRDLQREIAALREELKAAQRPRPRVA